MPYDSARDYCRNIGYDLAKISNNEENEHISRLLPAFTADSSWPEVYVGTCKNMQSCLKN